jgi:hypothetical protein
MKKLVNLMLSGTLFLCLVFMAQTSIAVTMDDAIGIWLFDEAEGDTAADSSGNGNDGQLMDEPTWVDGKFGGGLSFDAEGPFVRIEVPSVQLSSWTAMIWIKPNNPRAGHYQGLIQAWPNQGEFQIDSNGAVGVHPVYGGNLEAQEWSHVTALVDNNNVRVFINGEEVINGAVGAVTFGQIGIGDLYEVPAGFNYKFAGIVDEVAIFNKAIAEDDVQNIMNDGLAKTLGIAAVSNSGKITATWGRIKTFLSPR